MAEGVDGSMWFGTEEGVIRYDGLEWKTFTVSSGLHGEPINALCSTGDGRIYAASDMGIVQFSEGLWHRVFPRQVGLPWPVDRMIEASDGSIWAATAWGALRLNCISTWFQRVLLPDIRGLLR
jgi:hypothetical protein